MTTRLAYSLGFIIVCAFLLTSYYIQFALGILPCPLCSLQRFSFGILAVLFLIGMAVSRKKFANIVIDVLALLTSTLGFVLAGRQVWLQHFPSPDNSECGVSLQYMMQVFPLQEVISKIFSGSAECSQRGFEFLSLNMAEWALLGFAAFIVFSIYLLIKEVLRT